MPREQRTRNCVTQPSNPTLSRFEITVVLMQSESNSVRNGCADDVLSVGAAVSPSVAFRALTPFLGRVAELVETGLSRRIQQRLGAKQGILIVSHPFTIRHRNKVLGLPDP